MHIVGQVLCKEESRKSSYRPSVGCRLPDAGRYPGREEEAKNETWMLGKFS